VFNRHSGTEQVENRILGDHEGFHAWKSCHEGLVSDNPRFVEYTTWNDYLEGSYLGGPYTNAQLWPDYRGNDLNHDAYRKVAERYVQAFKANGQYPAITRDLVAIAHRLHPEDAPGVNAGGAGIADDTDNAQEWTSSQGTLTRPLVRQFDYAVVEDRAYAYVELASAGDVRLTSGANVQTVPLAAGVHEVSVPLGAGVQKVELLRNGAVVLEATSARQVSAGLVELFNYNYETAHAQGT